MDIKLSGRVQDFLTLGGCALKFRFLSSVAAGAVATAFSAGLPAHAQPPAVHDWTGFYLGLNAGGAWGRSSADTTTDCSAAGSPPAYFCDRLGGGANATAVDAAGSDTMRASGFTGGVQAGYNWQQNNFVYGLETDFGAFKLNGSRQGNGTYPVDFGANIGDPFSVGSSFETNWLFTLRGRLGATLTPDLLAYVTGGLALTRLTVSNSFTDTNTNLGGHATENGSTTNLRTGWALGGGLEWALSKHWSVKGEYLYLDFGKKITATGTITDPGAGAGYAQGLSTSADLTAQVARVGVNYKF